jgi:hypothetical protein
MQGWVTSSKLFPNLAIPSIQNGLHHKRPAPEKSLFIKYKYFASDITVHSASGITVHSASGITVHFTSNTTVLGLNQCMSIILIIHFPQ